MSLAKRLSLIEAISVDYGMGLRMGYTSYDHTEDVALKALDEAIELLGNYSHIFDLQLKLIGHDISHKLHSRKIIEINNVQGDILDIVLKVYDNYYSNSNIWGEENIATMYVVDEGDGLCTIIIPYKA